MHPGQVKRVYQTIVDHTGNVWANVETAPPPLLAVRIYDDVGRRETVAAKVMDKLRNVL